jgi:hypothetical protein
LLFVYLFRLKEVQSLDYTLATRQGAACMALNLWAPMAGCGETAQSYIVQRCTLDGL